MLLPKHSICFISSQHFTHFLPPQWGMLIDVSSGLISFSFPSMKPHKLTQSIVVIAKLSSLVCPSNFMARFAELRERLWNSPFRISSTLCLISLFFSAWRILHWNPQSWMRSIAAESSAYVFHSKITTVIPICPRKLNTFPVEVKPF